MEAQRAGLLIQAELGALDARLFERFAAAGWPAAGTELELYCLRRLDRCADYLRPIAAAADDAAVKALQDLLESREAAVLEFATRVVEAIPEPARGDFLARLRVLLHARTLDQVAVARLEQYDRLVTESRTGQTVTKEIVERRKRLVRAYRRRHNLTVIGFALKLGLHKSTVNGIIAEDTNRFSTAGQRDLLDFLGIARDDWYAEA